MAKSCRDEVVNVPEYDLRQLSQAGPTQARSRPSMARFTIWWRCPSFVFSKAFHSLGHRRTRRLRAPDADRRSSAGQLTDAVQPATLALQQEHSVSMNARSAGIGARPLARSRYTERFIGPALSTLNASRSPRSSSSSTASRETKPTPRPARTDRLMASFESSSQRFSGRLPRRAARSRRRVRASYPLGEPERKRWGEQPALKAS